MKMLRRRPVQLALIAAATVLTTGAAASFARQAGEDAPPRQYDDAMAAFREVCIEAPSHQAILTRMRDTHWRSLSDATIPALLQGNGMVNLRDVREGQIAGQPVLLSVGELSGGSFCRIYFKPVAPDTMVRRLTGEPVLGSPLGAPDFKGKLNFPAGWTAIGWHRSAEPEWRALHYSYDAIGLGPNAGWQAIEVTRAL